MDTRAGIRSLHQISISESLAIHTSASPGRGIINPLDPTLTERFLSRSPEEETALTEPRLCHCGMAGYKSGGKRAEATHTEVHLSDYSECHDVSMGHKVVMLAMA